MVGVGPTALLVVALVKNRGEHLDLPWLGSVSQLAFGLALMLAGVVYYFVAGEPRPCLLISIHRTRSETFSR